MHNFSIVAQGDDRAAVYLYGDIGGGLFEGVTAREFIDDLKPFRGMPLDVHINSQGGDVFDGITMFNTLREWDDVTAYVDGCAASAATLPMCAAGDVYLATGAMIMVHRPWMFTAGNAVELRKQADKLDKATDQMLAIYETRLDMDKDAIVSMLDAETWMDAAEAVDMGFASEVAETPALAAHASSWFPGKTPEVAAKTPETGHTGPTRRIQTEALLRVRRRQS